jgi:hypothetical protein
LMFGFLFSHGIFSAFERICIIFSSTMHCSILKNRTYVLETSGADLVVYDPVSLKYNVLFQSVF